MSTPQPLKKYDGPENWDAIVIGSGMGGLTTAALLSKLGKRVLVLERHYTAGGYTHVFKRRDYEWDVGIHYVGDMHIPYTPSAKVMNFISDGSLEWEPMGKVYDRIMMPDQTYDLVEGRGALISQLVTHFPKEEKVIIKYFELLKQVTGLSKKFFMEKALPGAVTKFVGGRMRKGLLQYSSRSTLDVLTELGCSKRLIGVLCGQYGDHGLPPGQSSFAIHAMVVSHYLKGASYPVGGSSRIAESIYPVLEKSGSQVLIRAEVNEVLVKNGKAYGVKMEGGQVFTAKTIVSSTGYWNTMYKLLPSSLQPKQELNELGLEKSVAHICLYIGLKHTDEELNLGKSNFWIYPGYDHDESVAKYLANPEEDLPVCYISFPSSKDPTWQDRYPGRSTIEIITLAPYEWFQDWENGRWKHRGEDYETYKERMSQRLLDKLYEKVPQVKGKIDTYELSTPLSTKHFMNYESGELYGLNHTPSRFGQAKLRPRTHVKGLYLTGQDILTAGVSGALLGGVLTASAITKKNFLGTIMKAKG